MEKEFLKLWDEYEERKTTEAKIVKDADNLDVDFEIMEQRSNGHGVGHAFDENRVFVAKNRFFTKTAKKIWEELMKTDPHEWHKTARNRLNAGDWKAP